MFLAMEKRMQKIGLEWIYLFFALCFGSLICMIRPPCWVPDEVAHFGRAWQISEGYLLSPAKNVKEILEADGINPFSRSRLRDIKLPPDVEQGKMLLAEVPSAMIPSEYVLQPDEKVGQHFFTWEQKVQWFRQPLLQTPTRETIAIPNTGQYSFFAYIPQGMAVWLGRLFGGNVGTIYYLMCFSAMLFSATCVFFSMRLLPEKKLLIFFLAMMPTFLAEMASASADAVIYGVCFLGIAWLLSMRNKSELFNRYEICGLIILAISLGLLKSVYGSILLLYFMMPWKRMKNRSYFLLFGFFLLGLELMVANAWIYLAVHSKGVELLTAHVGGLDVDIEAQKAFVLAHPLEMLAVIGRTISLGAWVPETFICGGLSNVGLSVWMYGVYLVLLLLGSVCGNLELRLHHRLTMLIAFLTVFFGIFLINYLMWTEVGGQVIAGIFGRYFIPVALLLFCAFSSPITVKQENMLAVLGGSFSVGATLWTSYVAFY